jgi:hypothetical protein
VELAIPQDMQCKPGVAFITKADDGAVKHPLNRDGASAAGNFSYQFYALFPAIAPRINQSTNQFQRRKQ